jgi:2-iminobutanoate/2-iminopropanoate deaminase
MSKQGILVPRNPPPGERRWPEGIPIPAINRLLVLVVATVFIAACSDASADPSSGSPAPATATSPSTMERELVHPGVMLSAAAVYGDLVWTAGHLPDGVSPAAPIEDQVEQVLDNLERTLEAANAGFDTLLKTNVYLLDWDDWEAFNQIYEARIGRPHTAPPRTTVDIDQLGLGYRIEIEMVAHVRPK